MMCTDLSPVVFDPGNEPYLGRQLLYHFDQLICSAMEQNSETAPQTHVRELTDQQKMACQVIPQALSIMLSIRELIRQGYLFGAHVLLRSFVERAVILMYLYYCPQEIDCWNRGWNYRDAPSLSKMLEVVQKKQEHTSVIEGWKITREMNSLLHGKPDSAPWNLVSLGEGKVGHAVSKILDRPELCDDLCASMISWIVVVQGMMAAYFGKETGD
jgi:hypothetical protein